MKAVQKSGKWGLDLSSSCALYDVRYMGNIWSTYYVTEQTPPVLILSVQTLVVEIGTHNWFWEMYFAAQI